MNETGAWVVLGIEPTADERDIKRAYASRLKADRLDRDPARFIALRAAYEEALGHARNEQPKAQHVDPAPRSTSRQAPVIELDLADDQTAQESALDQAPLPADPPAWQPSLHRADAMRTEQERQAKPLPPMADSIRERLQALDTALIEAVESHQLILLTKHVLAHDDVQRFSSRNEIELELVELVVHFERISGAIVPLLAEEFAWSKDEIDLIKRFPAHCGILLQLLTPAAPPIEPPQVQLLGRSAGQWMASHWALRLLVLLCWPQGRQAIADMLSGPGADTRHGSLLSHWWLRAMRWFPPLHLASSVAGTVLSISSLSLLVPALDLPTSDLGFALIALCQVFVGIFGGYITLTWPWHLLKQSSLSFVNYWPLMAGGMVCAALGVRNFAWAAPALLTGLTGLLMLCGFRGFRRENSLAALVVCIFVLMTLSVGGSAMAPGPDGSGWLAIYAVALLLVSAITILDEAPHLRPPASDQRRKQGIALAIAAAALPMTPVPLEPSSAGMLAALLLLHWLSPLASPAWIERSPSWRLFAWRSADQRILLRLMSMLLLWGLCVSIFGYFTPATAEAGPVIASAALCMRAIWSSCAGSLRS